LEFGIGKSHTGISTFAKLFFLVAQIPESTGTGTVGTGMKAIAGKALCEKFLRQII
jgi:hypothetical protein